MEVIRMKMDLQRRLRMCTIEEKRREGDGVHFLF